MSTKITLSSVKAFIRKSSPLYIMEKTSFDGMTDCCEPCGDKSFHLAFRTDKWVENTLGIQGAWFVKGSRDYFRPYLEGEFTGIEVSNSCGHFILAVKS